MAGAAATLPPNLFPLPVINPMLDCITAMDARYRRKMPEINDFLTERSRIKWWGHTLAAADKELFAEKIIPAQYILDDILQAIEATTAEEAYDGEDEVGHDVRGWVIKVQSHLKHEESKPWVYFLNTSYDIINSAEMARFKACLKQIIIPGLKELLRTLAIIAINEAKTKQIGRTHGMHAVPITFGFAIAVIVDRLGKGIKNLERHVEELEGKFSGAVGASNAHVLFLKDPIGYEERVLARLDLNAPMISTQIIEPDQITFVISDLVIIAGAIATLANNARNLQRTEIAELQEKFGKKQVGSSTMAQKRNPLKSEQSVGTWKVLMPKIITVLLNLISDHERDLTNSISSRPDAETLAWFHLMVKTMNKTAKGWHINREKMIENLGITGDLIAAEPLQLALAAAGHPDSHEIVRQAAMAIQEQKTGEEKTLFEAVAAMEGMEEYIQKLTDEQIEVIKDPSSYFGIAPQRATRVANHWLGEFNLATA